MLVNNKNGCAFFSLGITYCSCAQPCIPSGHAYVNESVSCVQLFPPSAEEAGPVT